MGQLRLLCLTSIDQLRTKATEWDMLWQASEVTLPTARAELLAQWVEHFAPRSTFRAVVVEDAGQFVAALPLVAGRFGKLIAIGTVPDNEWSPGGDLLLDPTVDRGAALDLLVDGLRALSWPLLKIDAANLQTNRWQAFCDALERAGLDYSSRPLMQVGVVDIGRDWQAYLGRRSRNHRRYLRQAAARASEQGGAELEVLAGLSPDSVAAQLVRGFEVEHRSWKGRVGTSVASCPAIFEFYRRQAEYLALQGQLELCFLQHQGQAIAFEYGWRSKGVYFTPKVGYDERYEQLSPGQLLRARQIERLHCDSAARQVDYLGPLSAATSKWTTDGYTISGLVVALRRPIGSLLLETYCRWKPWLAAWRQSPAEIESNRWLPGKPAHADTHGDAVPVATGQDV